MLLTMPNTYSQIYVQIVFAVKGRDCFIKESLRVELQKYISGIINNKKQKLCAIYCMPDHTHLFISLKPDVKISDLVRDIKSNSSTFLKERKLARSTFSWQEGYGVFSYSKSQAQKVVSYILNQPVHHKKETFKNEYLKFLTKFGIEYDERYLFEFYN
jgi:putative transposase